MTRRNKHYHWTFVYCFAALMAMGIWGCSDDTGPGPDTTITDGGSGVDALSDGQTTPDSKPDAAPPVYEVMILHTNDLHDHLLGWGPNADYTPATTGDDSTVGGFARLAALVANERKAAGTTPVLLLDAGDFLMGSLFTWLGPSESPCLSLMQEMGYDAITIGNHEYDWSPKGLAQIINTAITKSKFSVPLVASNITFSATSAVDDDLEKLVTQKVIQPKLVKTLQNGLKVGFFGLLGSSAAGVTYDSDPLVFEDIKKVSIKMVKELRETDKVDLVVAVSHSGANASGPSGNDVSLAQAVSGIDVIISGHTHTKLSQPLEINDTLIVQAGEYGQYLGKLELKVQGKKVSKKKYTLLAVDDTIKGDPAVQTKVDGYISTINTSLKGTGYQFKKIIAETAFDLTFPALQETILGNIITDAYRSAATQATPLDPVHVALESGGVIRDVVNKGKTGKLMFADLIRVLPLGIGPDSNPGFPLVAIYLTGAELKKGMEILPLAKDYMKSNDYFLQASGLTVEYDSKAAPLSQVKKLTVGGSAAVDTNCYKVVMNLYVAGQIAAVGAMFPGLSLTPKEKGCTTKVTDLKKQIIKTSTGAEVKAWQALVQFLQSFPDTNQNLIPDVKSEYAKLQGRITFK